jgi:hypothetical protein
MESPTSPHPVARYIRMPWLVGQERKNSYAVPASLGCCDQRIFVSLCCLEARVGRTFRYLPRRAFTAFHYRSDDANGVGLVL